METPGKQGLKAPGNISSTSSSSKGAPQAAATAAAAAGPGSGILVITESAAGFDLRCPAGQYRLNLAHPAVRHMLGQLLELRSRLQQLQQQVKQQQLEQQQLLQQPAKATVAAAAGGSGGKASANRRTSNDATPVGSRNTSPVPSGRVSPQGELNRHRLSLNCFEHVVWGTGHYITKPCLHGMQWLRVSTRHICRLQTQPASCSA